MYKEWDNGEKKLYIKLMRNDDRSLSMYDFVHLNMAEGQTLGISLYFDKDAIKELINHLENCYLNMDQYNPEKDPNYKKEQK